MASLAPGTWAYLYYDGDDVWHVRLLLAWCDGAEYVVLSPDYDMFIEEISAANADLGGLRIAGQTTELPVGLAGQPVYAFNPPLSGAQVGDLILEGSRMARAERQARGLAPAAGAPARANSLAPAVVPIALPVAVLGGAPVGPRIAGPGGCWFLDEPGPLGNLLGKEVVVPAGCVDFGGRTFVTVDSVLCSASFVEASLN